MGDELTGTAEVQTIRNGLEDLARSLHASYLDRWNRHDPAGLERQAETQLDERGAPASTSAA